MIVKVQVLYDEKLNRRLLVYDENKKRLWQGRCPIAVWQFVFLHYTERAKTPTGTSYKAYFEAHFEDKKVVLDKPAPAQSW